MQHIPGPETSQNLYPWFRICFKQDQLHHETPSGTIDFTGRWLSALELEKLLNSPEQHSKMRDTINKLQKDDPLGTNGPEVMARVRKHKPINTKENQVIYSCSAAAANKVENTKKKSMSGFYNNKQTNIISFQKKLCSQTNKEWRKRTLVYHELLKCSKMCFTKTG